MCFAEDGFDDFDGRDELVGALDASDMLIDEAAVHPLDDIRWTAPQKAFLSNLDRYRCFRTGNQFGKTWAGAAECIYRCLGYHPFKQVRKGPIEAWVVCKSWSQSIAIQKKIWALLPKDAIAPETKFTAKDGFLGKEKAVVFLNGSVLRIKTVGQDQLDLESATIHYVWIDEPIGSADIFAALQMRLRRTGGAIAITMTPATTGDLTWLRELVDSGRMTDLHFRMEPEYFIPEGATEPFKTEEGELMDAAWVAAEIAKTLSWQVGVRCHGEWEYSATDCVFAAFARDRHRVVNLAGSGLLPGTPIEIDVGIDFGEEALRTCGVHVYADLSGLYPRIFVMGEYAPEGATTIEMDAEGLVGMAAACGDRWTDIDRVWADKKYEGKSSTKSARGLGEAIAKRLGLTGDIRPGVAVAKRGLRPDHFWPSVRWIHEAMIRPGHFYVDASCEWLIRALETWDGTTMHKAKDIIDALRYALRHLWAPRSGAPGRVLSRRF